MLQREESRHDFAFIAGVVIGAVAGAVATLAVAPSTGRETRDKVRARMNTMSMDEVKGYAAAATTTARETLNAGVAAAPPKAQEVVGRTKATATDLVNRSPLPVELATGSVTEVDVITDMEEVDITVTTESVADTVAEAADTEMDVDITSESVDELVTGVTEAVEENEERAATGEAG